jgi:hypothetical protein
LWFVGNGVWDLNTLKISGLFLERARLVSKVVVDYPELEVLILARARGFNMEWRKRWRV